MQDFALLFLGAVGVASIVKKFQNIVVHADVRLNCSPSDIEVDGLKADRKDRKP